MMTDAQLRSRWRMLAWGGAAGLLALPATAMQFTTEVQWTAIDFVVMGALLGSLALAFDLLIRRGGLAYQLGAAVGLGAVFLLVWLNLAVGIIGDEDDPANLLFAAVIAIAVGGACAGRFRAAAMARAMLAAAAAQAMVVPIVLAAEQGADAAIWPREVLVLSAFFVAMWLGAAWLFRSAAKRSAATTMAEDHSGE